MMYMTPSSAFSSFIYIHSYSNLTEKFNTSIALNQRNWIKNNRRVLCSDDIINIMIAFFDKHGPIFHVYLKNFAFLTQIMKKYAIVEIST